MSVTFPHFSKDEDLPRQACGRRCETRSGEALPAAVAMEPGVLYLYEQKVANQ